MLCFNIVTVTDILRRDCGADLVLSECQLQPMKAFSHPLVDLSQLGLL